MARTIVEPDGSRVSDLVVYSIPAFLALVALEAWWASRHPEVKGYEKRDTAASLTMGVLNVIVSSGAKLLTIPLFAWMYEHRIANLGQAAAWWSWLVLLFAEDLCYYAFHRAHHEIRLLWAVHVNHHSSQYFNLSTALRQALLTPITGPMFWTPLGLLGYPPWMVLTAQAWSLLYQFWLHTEAIDRLGPLEWMFNTPSHHRVHHGKNARYLDRNHAGIFIVWDRLFGTFEPERERVVYGLTKDISTFHPWRIAFHEALAIAGDVRRARTRTAKLKFVLGRPDWTDQQPSNPGGVEGRASR
jgi:sterol desaturase/sphingolipid hydroxylase (fatty acid hydroxylase superfamily)